MSKHYWEIDPGKFANINPQNFKSYLKLCGKILWARKTDSDIGGVYYNSKPIQLGNDRGCKTPIINISVLYMQFNGFKENSYEAFNIDVKSKGFFSCNTGEKDYDIFVVACLIALKRLFLSEVKINSDSSLNKLKPGLNLYNTVVKNEGMNGFSVNTETLKIWLKQ